MKNFCCGQSEWLFARSTFDKCFWAGIYFSNWVLLVSILLHRNRSCQEILYCYQSALLGYYQIKASLMARWYWSRCIKYGGNSLHEYHRLDKSCLCQHDTAECLLPSWADTTNFSFCWIESEEAADAREHSIGLNYSQVCGQLIGYQFGVTGGFKRWEPSEAHMDLHSWN